MPKLIGFLAERLEIERRGKTCFSVKMEVQFARAVCNAYSSNKTESEQYCYVNV